MSSLSKTHPRNSSDVLGDIGQCGGDAKGNLSAFSDEYVAGWTVLFTFVMSRSGVQFSFRAPTLTRENDWST